jgi:NAD(P)H-flavin reductase
MENPMVSGTHEKNEYLPRKACIRALRDLSHDVRHFTLSFVDAVPFSYEPGQFVQVSLFGAGEAPISITSSHQAGDSLELAIRRTGKLSDALHTLKVNDELFIRGPYGRSFDCHCARGRDVLFLAGGIGLVPLRSLVRTMITHRHDYGRIWLLFGAREPADLVYLDETREWEKAGNFKVLLTVDHGDSGWKGAVGIVTTLLKDFTGDPAKTTAYVCGPLVMIRHGCLALIDRGFEAERIITTMEMHMKCGIGKCGHCNIGNLYCCTDGPVFSCAALREAGELR